MPTQVILLQRVEKLGNMGDVVAVKPGYARNYLLPQKKALRASKDNIAYFEAQKKHLEAESNTQKKEAEKLAKTIEGLKVPLIRAASESGQLYGSVNTRDIAQEAAKESGQAITREMVKINQNFKTVGLFPVNIQLHPEVIVEITVNIARSSEEAKTQAKTGKALVADDGKQEEAPSQDALADVLEDSALEAQKEKAVEAEEKAADDAERAVKSEARKAKKAAKAPKAEEEDVSEMEKDVPSQEDDE